MQRREHFKKTAKRRKNSERTEFAKQKGSKYTKELLEEAVKQSSSFTQVCFNLRGTDRGVTHIKKKILDYGIDISHFKQRRFYSDEEIEEATVNCKSFTEIVKYLKITSSTGCSDMKKRVAKLELDTSHFEQPKMRPPTKKSPAELLIKRTSGARTNGWRLRRALLELGREYECEAECSIKSEWNGIPLKLQVDHKNGDPLDNRSENLRFLCPNCHSQTRTYGARNGKQVRERMDDNYFWDEDPKYLE